MLAALTLHFVLVRGGGWTRADLERHLAKVAAVYAQCGVEVSAGEIAELDAPGGRSRFLKYSPGAPGSIEELARESPVRGRPVFYLVAGFDDVSEDSAFSRAPFEEGGGGDPVLHDSVFLPAAVNGAAWERERAASPYSVAAHELWHVLTRVGGHFNEPRPFIGNIWMRRSDYVPPADCERVRANPLVRALP